MTTLLTPPIAMPRPTATRRTMAEVLRKLGDIPSDRVWVDPLPGTATEEDVLAARAMPERWLCELVDGVLVEKPRGFKESALASTLIGRLHIFVAPRKTGTLIGADGMMRLAPGLVRVPDVSYVSWDRLQQRHLLDEPIPAVGPDLAAEVLSESNTPREMARKIADYFNAKARLVWLIDPRKRSVTVYTAPDKCTVLDSTQTLDGGDVLPGFVLPLSELFAELDEPK